jgi:hypothetical protein
MAAVTRAVNALLVAAALAVGGLAVADALRGGEGSGRTVAAPRFAAAAAGLERAGVTGTLYFTDASCRLRALRLPQLVSVRVPKARSCAVVVAARPLTSASWSLWRPGSRLVAFCRAGRVLVRAARGPTLPFIAGCAPAWAPDGSLDFVRQGSAVQFVAHGRAEVIVPHPREAPVRRIAWLGRLLAAVVGDRLRLLDGTSQVAERRLPSPIAQLRPSPRGTWLAVRAGARTLVFDRRLRRHALVRASAVAVAWSPDERWLAVATPGGVQIVGVGGGPAVTLPLLARDLAWR